MRGLVAARAFASHRNCVRRFDRMCRMGGDRDGNPFVTPQTTRDVVITSRLAATNLYFTAVEKLMYELSVWRCSDELKVRQSRQCIIDLLECIRRK